MASIAATGGPVFAKVGPLGDGDVVAVVVLALADGLADGLAEGLGAGLLLGR